MTEEETPTEENPTDSLAPPEIKPVRPSPVHDLEEFNRILTALRNKHGYTYQASQRYFKRVYGIEKDDFETKCQEVDNANFDT